MNGFRLEGQRGAYTLDLTEVRMGGQALVYRGRRAARSYAVKIARRPGPELARERDALMRLAARDADARDWIVEVHDHGTTPDGRDFLVMDWFPSSLEDWLGSNPPLPETIDALLRCAAAVARLHRASALQDQLLHGDIKPANFLIDPSYRPARIMLADLGGLKESRILATTQFEGLHSPGFAPVEQALPLARPPDPSLDVHGLAATVYYALCGRLPDCCLRPMVWSAAARRLLLLHAAGPGGRSEAEEAEFQGLRRLPLEAHVQHMDLCTLSDADEARLAERLADRLPEADAATLGSELALALLPELRAGLTLDPSHRSQDARRIFAALGNAREILRGRSGGELPLTLQTPPSPAPRSSWSRWPAAAVVVLGGVTWLRLDRAVPESRWRRPEGQDESVLALSTMIQGLPFPDDQGGTSLGLGRRGFAVAGDFDGDGRADLALAGAWPHSRSAGANAGSIWVFRHGHPMRLLTDGETRWQGLAADDQAGYGLARLDADGDGDDELVIGAPRNADGHGHQTGSVYLLDQPLIGGGSLADASSTVVGESAEALAGGDIARLDGGPQGGPDALLIGSQYAALGAPYSGAAYVLAVPEGDRTDLSLADGVLCGDRERDSLGMSVAAVDLNTDGIPDVLAGGAGYHQRAVPVSTPGAVVVVEGPLDRWVSALDADRVWTGDSAQAQLGIYHGVQPAGDVDGDGAPDVLLGAVDDTTHRNAGVVYLMTGSADPRSVSGQVSLRSEAILRGEHVDDEAGAALAAPGDINGDGFDDVLIGATGSDQGQANTGRVYLLYGPLAGDLSLGEADHRLHGLAQDDRLAQVAGVGDQDDDGRPDMLIGAPGVDLSSANTGAAWLWTAAVATGDQ